MCARGVSVVWIRTDDDSETMFAPAAIGAPRRDKIIAVASRGKLVQLTIERQRLTTDRFPNLFIYAKP